MKLNKNLIINISFALSLLILTLIVYIITLSRSVYFGDSGELIAVAKTLGIAHPPGYPLYTMLAHLFTYLPFGNLAFKVNLFSAVTSSLTVVVVYFICLKLTRNRLASISASLFLAFSYLFWLYSLVTEVFSLNNLFVALITLIAIYIMGNPKNIKLFYLLSFVFGLALTNHHTILLLIPALLFLILTTNPKLFLQPKFLLLALFFFLLGLAPYIYLPIRDNQNPTIALGAADNIGRFFHHVLRRDYGTFSFGSGKFPPFNIDVLIFYFTSLFWHFAVIGAIFALFGFIFSFKQKRLYLFLLLAYLFLGPIFILFTRLPIVGDIDAKGVLERFFMSSYIIVSLWISIGLVLISFLVSRLSKPLIFLIPMLVLIPLILNFPKVNQSKNFIYEEFGKKMFDLLPKNAILISLGDRTLMTSLYLQNAKGQRPDLKIIIFSGLIKDWYKEDLRRNYPELNLPWDELIPNKFTANDLLKIICEKTKPAFQSYTEARIPIMDLEVINECSWHPVGFLYSFEERDKNPNLEELLSQEEIFWQPFLKDTPKTNLSDFRTRAIILNGYSLPRTFFGMTLEYLGESNLAQKAYEDAFEVSNDNAFAAYLIGNNFYKKGDFDKAMIWEKRAVKLDPTLSQSYKLLGDIFLNQRSDKTTALSFFRKYLKYSEESQEKNQIRKLVENLEKSR